MSKSLPSAFIAEKNKTAAAPFNAMLLQVQKPGLTYAASAADWRLRFGRKPKEGARPLLILWPFAPVALVYDVMDTEGEDLPDVGSAETRASRGWRLGNPYWTGPSNRIAYRLHGRVLRLRTYFVRSPEERIPLRRVSMAGSPPILSRSTWGANEAIRLPWRRKAFIISHQSGPRGGAAGGQARSPGDTRRWSLIWPRASAGSVTRTRSGSSPNFFRNSWVR